MRISKIVLCCLLVLGCHKKEVKNAPRSIYDQPVFAELSLLAAKEDVAFAHFKRDPFFNLLWENHTFEEGREWLQKIEAEYPGMKEKFDLFRQIDQVGSPRVFDYGQAGLFSPSTLRLVALAGDLKARMGRGSCKIPRPGKIDDFEPVCQGRSSGPCPAAEGILEKVGADEDMRRSSGPSQCESGGVQNGSKGRFCRGGEFCNCIVNLSDLAVVQIGAGCGGLCKALHAMEGFGSYTIVDLPEPLALAKKCLENMGVENVIFLTPEELPKNGKYDLAISDRSFSEFNHSYQKLFLDRIISSSRSAYLVGHIFPKHYGVIPLSFEELKGRFEKNKKCATWEIQEPTLENENYFFYYSG